MVRRPSVRAHEKTLVEYTWNSAHRLPHTHPPSKFLRFIVNENHNGINLIGGGGGHHSKYTQQVSFREPVHPSVRRRQCSNIVFSTTACPIKAKFYVEPPWVGGAKVCSWHLGHLTKMVATPIYGKPFKNLLLRNRQADFHETWYVASGTPAHHNLF